MPPRKGRAHVLRVLRELFYHRPEGRGTDIAGALEYLTHVVRRRAVAFLVSDFMSEGFEKPLSVAGRRHDLIAVRLGDRREESLPPLRYVEFEDAETGELFLVNTSDARFQNRVRGAVGQGPGGPRAHLPAQPGRRHRHPDGRVLRPAPHALFQGAGEAVPMRARGPVLPLAGVFAALALAVVAPSATTAQAPRVRTALDTTLVSVGDRLQLTVTVEHAPGETVVWPDSLSLDPFEILGAELLAPTQRRGPHCHGRSVHADGLRARRSGGPRLRLWRGGSRRILHARLHRCVWGDRAERRPGRGR